MSQKKKTQRPQPPKKKFDEKALVTSLWKTMRGQEKKNPALALLHHRLEGGVFLIGLTGGIASGKSLVSQFLEEAHVPVIDADKIARDIVQPGQPAYRKIVSTFGRSILDDDKQIHRARLSDLVFSDLKKREKLEAITHPEIFRAIGREVESFQKAGQKLMVIDAALLFESGLADYVDTTVLVKTDPETQLKRLMERDHLELPQARDRIHSQMPTAEKEKRAHHIIDNSGHPEETRRQLLKILLSLNQS